MVILLVAMGAVFSLLFVLNSLLRAAQGREKVSFLETLLAFLALVFPVLALVNNTASAQPLSMVNMAAIGIGLVLVVISLITFFVERRKSGRPLSQRRGVFGIGLGILLIVATFIVPIASKLPSAAANRNAAANVPASASNVNIIAEVASPTVVKTEEVTPTNTPDVKLLELSATPTRFPSPMPTATNTPFVIATATLGTPADENQATGQSAAAQITGCTAVVRQNVNLRSGPGKDFQLLVTIPFSSTLDVSAKNKAGDWWYVKYDSQSGWVSGDYVNVPATCGKLPTKSSE